jgi:hypothetical protein
MDHIVETIVEPSYKNHDTSLFLSIASPFPTNESFEHQLYEAPVLTGPVLRAVEHNFGGLLFHWNGMLLHVALNTHLDIGYAIMHIAGYITAPNGVIFEGFEHTIHYLFFYCHVPILYPHRPLNNKYLAMNLALIP